MALENCHFDDDVSSITRLGAVEPFFLLQHHVFLEHTDPTYEFCGIQRTWETCHRCKVLLNLLLWPVLFLNHSANSFFHGLHSLGGW